MTNEKFIIGIDLGTTFSCVCVKTNNGYEVIQNEDGNRITHSVVSFDDEEQLVGDPAWKQIGKNPKNTIYNIKRIIGRDFNDNKVQSEIKHWPFKVIEKNNRPYVKVEYRNEIKEFTAEEISSMILTKMKNIAEDYIGQTVTDAVITVPAYFSDTQRRATIDAGKIAGLNVLRIINEPTAAALAYGYNNKVKCRENILVVDLGGGTYDVSLLSINNGDYDIKAIAGDNHLGGEDFTNRLIEYCIDEIKSKYGKDVTTCPKSEKILSNLRKACEETKKSLSFRKSVSLDVVYLFDGINYESTITRSRFEELNSDLFSRVLKPIQSVIEDSKIQKSDISEIVLVGGSTRIPKVREIISSYFEGIELKKTINPDEAVAYGAAIQASIYSEDNNNIFISDVIPLSLGTSVKGGIMSTIIKRNTKIPVRKTQTYYTVKDNQTSILVDVYEGEQPLITDNKLLDDFTLKGITPAPRGETEVDISFEIDKNGVLRVSASEKGTNLYNEITVVNNKGRLYQSEIDRMIKQSRLYKENNKKNKERIEVMNNLESYAYKLSKVLKTKAKPDIYNKYINIINNTIEWIKNNKDASTEEFKRKKIELDILLMKI